MPPKKLKRASNVDKSEIKKSARRNSSPLIDDLVVEINKGEGLDAAKLSLSHTKSGIKNWFNQIRKGVKTPTKQKINTPEGLWHRCTQCGHITSQDELHIQLYVCPECNKHHRIGSKDYMNLLFDNSTYKELYSKLEAVDMLHFKDLKSYRERIDKTQKTTSLKEALRIGVGKIEQTLAVISCMDFDFIGGSIGSVMGEKFCRAVDYAIKKKAPYIAICQSGGARMMESAYSLMQMPKTCARLHLLAEASLPYIVLLTDPTYGGITASLGMVGDIHIAEPKARIGFAGPRVIKELIRKELPEGFQTSERFLEKGFIDMIVNRKSLKSTIGRLLKLLRA